MATTIKLKNSVTTTAAPSSLVQGEVAVNVTDKKVWVGNAASGIVQILGAGATVAGTTATLTGDASISGLTVGKGYGSLSQNTVFGVSALSSASLTGNYNTAIGYQAGYSNTTGTRITALGVEAIKTNTTGNYNTSIGYQSLTLNSTGSFNTACGDSSLLNTTGSNNTALGMGAGQLITSGTKNTIVGMYNGNQNGLDIRTASNYIVLSDGDGNPRFLFNGAAGYLNTLTQRNSGQLSIDYNGSTNGGMGINDTASANGSTFIGFLTGGTFRGSINNVANTAVAYNTTSDYRLKENIAPMTGALATVSQLKPCTYVWKETGYASQGFIAHELAEICPDCVTGEKDAVDADGNPKYQGVDTSFLVATLTAAIQELKAEFDAYKATHP